jgi:hypothetical protein
MSAGGGASKGRAPATAVPVRPWPHQMTDVELVEALVTAARAGNLDVGVLRAELLARLARGGAPAAYVQHTPRVVV